MTPKFISGRNHSTRWTEKMGRIVRKLFITDTVRADVKAWKEPKIAHFPLQKSRKRQSFLWNKNAPQGERVRGLDEVIWQTVPALWRWLFRCLVGSSRAYVVWYSVRKCIYLPYLVEAGSCCIRWCTNSLFWFDDLESESQVAMKNQGQNSTA